MTRPRIVLDTNVVVSAALQPSGLEAFVIELVATRQLHVCASNEIIEEYRDVFSRPKFSKLDGRHVSHLLALLIQEATIVYPTAEIAESPDPSDNRFLECSETAEADFLVTGNKRHFPQRWKGSLIVNVRELLKALSIEPAGD
jgi:putative PIN family toxin of toxin-antitoxin system